MEKSKHDVQMSKALSYILRHGADKEGNLIVIKVNFFTFNF